MPIAKQMLSAPVILVGRILSSSKVGRPRHYEVEGIRDYAQLYQVTVPVENVLKGDVPTNDAEIYFFLPAGSYVGSALLGIEGQRGTWKVGDHEMFFLNRDSGVLRTTCDFYRRYVIPVFSCAASPSRRDDTGKQLKESIVDLLLTGAQNCGEQQMADAIRTFDAAERFDREYAFKKMRQLAAEGTPPVRKAACEWLFSWKQPCIKPAGK
jgi:hypothetical protein